MEQEIKTGAGEIISKLVKLQKDMDYIREHIEDINLTEDYIKALEEAEKEYKEGKTISLDDLKKEIGV